MITIRQVIIWICKQQLDNLYHLAVHISYCLTQLSSYLISICLLLASFFFKGVLDCTESQMDLRFLVNVSKCYSFPSFTRKFEIFNRIKSFTEIKLKLMKLGFDNTSPHMLLIMFCHKATFHSVFHKFLAAQCSFLDKLSLIMTWRLPVPETGLICT